ncbi:MAG: class II aldolase/adducin family protein [Deltaproteobacteria bacterium]|nr:class II aldolase/adducin family protein [Deltaproteobacteria bacterium]
MEQPAARRELVKYSLRIWERGWVANHDGNLSLRLGRDRILTTPTAFSKQEVTEEDLLVVEISSGKVLSGRHRPFSELGLHLEYFQTRKDVQAVVHAHPPTASGFSVAGIEVEPRITAEAVVSLGDRIPLAPLAPPGGLEARTQIRYLGRLFDALLLSNHGVITCGDSLEQAYLRMELVEHLARMQQQAMLLGNLRLIPDAWVQDLLGKRKKAGLGPEARGQKAPPRKDISKLPVEDVIAALVEQLKG